MTFKLKDFNQNGVAWPFKINGISSELENEYNKFQDKAIKTLGHPVTLKPNLLSTFFDSFLDHPSILPKVKELIGENIYVWSSAFFPKTAGDGKFISFHQDNPYWQLSNDKVVTVWIALTRSDESNGALQLVPKSHKIGIINNLDVENSRESYLQSIKTTSKNDLLSFNQNLDKFMIDNPAHAVILNPGEFSIHHLNTVHGSDINKSKKNRIGFAIRYISSESQHVEVNEDWAIHISGKKNNFYKNEKRPVSDFDLDSINQNKLSSNSTGVFGNKKYS